MQENPAAFVELSTHLRRRRVALRALIVLLAVAVGGWFAAFALQIAHRKDSSWWPLLASLVAGAGGIGAMIYAAFLTQSRDVIRPAHFDVARFAAKPEVSGWLEGRGVLALRDRYGEVARVFTGDDDAARGMLERLHLAPEQRSARIPLSPKGPLASVGLLTFAAIFLFGFTAVTAAGVDDIARGLDLVKVIVVGFCLAAVGVAAFGVKAGVHRLEGGEAIVGTDGLVIRNDGKEFVLHASRIAAVSRRGTTVIVTPVAGKIIVLDVESGGPDAGARAEALVTLITRCMASARGPGAERAEKLAQNGRTAEAWRADLAAAARGGGNYRVAELDRDELGAVIADGGASPERRVGAAIALRAVEPENARERILSASAACATEDMRVLLEAAAEGEIDEPRLARAMLHRGERR